MEKTNNEYIDSFNKLWHRAIGLTQFRKTEQHFLKLKELSTVEIGIIRMVSQKPDIIFKEICEAFDIPKSTLTNIIDRLEKRGYLKRIISQRDKRSFGLELTEAGISIQKEHLDYENEVLNTIINTLDSDDEKKMLLNLISKIINKLEKK